MSLIQNNKFEFVIYKENFLSNKECDELIKTLDTDELTDGTIVGDYEDDKVNQNVRQTLNIDFHDENLFNDFQLFTDLEEFKARSDLIVTNRRSNQLDDVESKLFTRDIFSEN